MKYHLDSMLPIRAFSPRSGRARGFAAGGMTLEGDGGQQYWQDPAPESQSYVDNAPAADQGSVTVTGAPPDAGGGGGGAVDQGTLNQLYEQYLGRGVDPSGAASWTGQDYNTVVQGLLGSQEYASRGGDQGGGGGGLSGIGATTGGAMVGGGLSGMDSGAAPTNETEFVNKLYHDMFNRAPDEGAQNWINALQSGQMTPQDVANSFVSSQEAQQNDKSQSIEQQIADAIAAGYTGNAISPEDRASQAKLNDPYLKNLNIDSADAQSLLALKSSNPAQYYEQVAQKLKDQVYEGYRTNSNYSNDYNALQNLKTVSPIDYYKNQLDFLSNQIGWQIGQNRSDRNAPIEEELKKVAIEAQNAGMKFDDVKNIVNKGAASANIQNQQRIANEAETGGSGFNFQKDIQPGLVMLALATAAAMTAQPELLSLGEAGAGAGAVGAAGATGAAGTTAASTLPSWLTAAGQGALTGGAMGGINAGMSGGDVGQGILRGGLTGAVGGGLGNFAGGTFGSPLLGQVIGGAGAGAAGSALTGNDVLKGALYGGGGGLLNYGLGQIPGLQSTPGQFGLSDLARGAISGGTLTSAMGGNFGQGALSGASGAYLSNMVSPYISGAYNKAFGSPNNINVSNNQPISPMYPEGSGYAGNGGFTQAPLQISSANPLSTNVSLGNDVPPEAVGFGSNGEVHNQDGSITVPVYGGNFGGESGGVAMPQVTLNTDGSVSLQNSNGEVQTIPPGDKATSIFSNAQENNKQIEQAQNAEMLARLEKITDAEAAKTDSVVGNGRNIFGGTISPLDRATTEAPFGPGAFLGSDAGINGSVTGAQSDYSMQDVGAKTPTKTIDGLDYQTGGFQDTKMWDPNSNSWIPIQTPAGEGGLSTAPFNQPGLEATGSQTATDTTGEVDNKPVQPPNPDAPVLKNVDRESLLADAQAGELPTKEKVDAALIAGKISKEDADTYKEVIKEVEDATGGTGNKGQGPGAGLTGEGPGRGTDEGPLGAMGPEGLIGDITGMSNINTEPGDGTGTGDGTGDGTGGEGEGGGGGGAGGGGGGGTGGTGKGTGSTSGGKPGGGLPYIYKPQTTYRQGVAPMNPGITNLTPGLTKANQNYGLAGLLPTSEPTNPMFHDNETPLFHAATGGLATTGTNQTGQNTGTAESLTPGVTSHTVDYILSGIVPLGKATGGAASTADLFNDKGAYNYANVSDSKLTPALTKHKIDYLLAGLPSIGKAEGGSIHTPQFYSEGGASMENRYVQGNGDGTSDSIPAMLANGEFVIPADIVSNLGNGSNDSGAKVLDEFLRVIRQHKQKHDVKRLPPNSKGPLAYLTDAKRKVKK
jgi:hypothetical protein